MKHCLKPIFALLVLIIFATTSVLAQSGEKVSVALITDDFELAETDISTLAIGEAKTIETASGRIIDILRTNDGAEIYVDGEMLDIHVDDNHQHAEHITVKHLEITCEGEDECEKHVMIGSGLGTDGQDWTVHGDHDVVIHEEIEITCNDEDEDVNCDKHVIWISDDENYDVEEFHGEHTGGKTHEIIVIKKKLGKEG